MDTSLWGIGLIVLAVTGCVSILSWLWDFCEKLFSGAIERALKSEKADIETHTRDIRHLNFELETLKSRIDLLNRHKK